VRNDLGETWKCDRITRFFLTALHARNRISSNHLESRRRVCPREGEALISLHGSLCARHPRRASTPVRLLRPRRAHTTAPQWVLPCPEAAVVRVRMSAHERNSDHSAATCAERLPPEARPTQQHEGGGSAWCGPMQGGEPSSGKPRSLRARHERGAVAIGACRRGPDACQFHGQRDSARPSQFVRRVSANHLSRALQVCGDLSTSGRPSYWVERSVSTGHE